VGKPEKKKPLGRSRRRWEDNIQMNLRDIRWGGGDKFIWVRIRPSGRLL
jgi:hypothetical protein